MRATAAMDGFAQDTPIGEIVDSCRVWESHSDSNRVSMVNYDSEVGSQPSDSRSWERRKVVVDMKRREPDVGNRKDDSRLGALVDRLCHLKLEETRKRDRPPTGGPVCLPGGNQCPQASAVHPHLPGAWLSSCDNEQYRVKNNNQKLMESPEHEQRFEREGQPLGPPGIKTPLTLGGGFRRNKQRNPHWCVQRENSKRGHWAADSQEFPSLEAQRTAGNTKGSAGPSTTEMGRRPMGHPTPVFRNLDRGMRPAKDTRSVPRGNRNARTWGVQKPIVTSLSALAENFIPRKTSKKRPTQPTPTDNDLDRSLAKTGSSKIETPRDSIECEIATIGMACPTEIGKPVAMADVAESSGPAGTGAGGPVVAGMQFPAVADRTGASGPKRSETGSQS